MEEQQSTSGARTSGQKEERGSSRFRHQLETEAYAVQKQRWPKLGKFILAQYTPEAILVYQAFKPEIGRYAVANQRFTGCGGYSPTRMTWIKTNFLWMMYRSGWGDKKNQEVTLGIWLKREAFDRYVSIACKKGGSQKDGSVIRLQWDPDHHPSGAPLKNRRAIQLGLKNVLSFANGEDILRIDDMTEFVAGCARNDTSALITPKETIYDPQDPAIVANLGLSHEDEVRSEEGKQVAAAMQEGRSVWISYKGGSHERKPREVRPLRWQPHTAKSLFVAQCGYTGGEKDFYVHNILARHSPRHQGSSASAFLMDQRHLVWLAFVQELRHEPWTMEETEDAGSKKKTKGKNRKSEPAPEPSTEEDHDIFVSATS